MKIIFKTTRNLEDAILKDLARPHPIAAERVGFVSCRVANQRAGLVILAEQFHSVADEDYLDNPDVGAMMGSGAIRKALQFAYNNRIAMFHVHVHEHYGQPWFSRTDLAENAKFVPDFWNVRPEFPHGAIVLSRDSIAGLCWIPGESNPKRITEFTLVGKPMRFVRGQLLL